MNKQAESKRTTDSNNQQKPLTEQTPTEKLQDAKPIGSQVPGAQDLDSEIKGEKNLNTE